MMRRFKVGLILSSVCIAMSTADPDGHMKPLRSHVPSIEIWSRDTVPNPVVFFNEYVKPGIPVILRGAAKSMPNFKTWRDDDYLREKYGRWLINFTIGKYENGSTSYQKMANGSFRQFLNVYQKSPVYFINSVVGENPMADDLVLPRCLACGGYKENVTSVPIFFSSGGTNTALHRDDFDNLICMFDGSKEWLMFDRKVFPPEYYDSTMPGYCAVNTLKVDMHKYPALQNMSMYRAVLNTGDCMFVPMRWPHHVLSDARRNMGVSIWWTYMHQVDLQDCPKNLDDLPEYRTLGKFGITNRDDVRSSILSVFMDRGDVVKKSDALQMFENKDVSRNDAEELFDKLDINGDGLLQIQEASSANLTDVENGKYEFFGTYFQYAAPKLIKEDL